MSEEEFGSERLAENGLKFTKLYLIVLFGGIPTAAYFGIVELHHLKLNELGDFLAGAFGPLAIFWLVLGFFQQGKELRNSVDALNLQAEELRHSVAQQKAMVGITTQQLELDIDVRRDQSAAQRSKELPYIQLRGGGSSAMDGVRNYKFYVRNVEAACLDLNVEMEETDEIQGIARSLGYLNENSESEFTVRSLKEKLIVPEKSYVLSFISKNIRDQSRKQVFVITNGRVVLESCDPELT
ncbi:hypothetical protein [Shimia sp.]|uniref:hypothetical protein n=1 Tax=Shimia sp. TaxID=1954381 RepID=UPI00329755BA